MRRPKISIVGAGNVGAAAAMQLAGTGVFDIALVDNTDGLARGRALDIRQAAAIAGSDAAVEGDASYEITRDSDVVVIAAGLPRLPGMSRDDLLQQNAETVASCVRSAMEHSEEPILIVVTNPLDAMCHVAMQVSCLPRKRVIGMAGILDTGRFRTFIAEALGVSARNVDALVLGGHGDTMVPLPRFSTVAGAPVAELLDAHSVDEIITRTRGAGSEIVDQLRGGGAAFAPAAGVGEMIRAIHGDEHKILPCSVLLKGEYNIDGVFLGVPCVLGTGGLIRVVDLDLSVDEMVPLRMSADAVAVLRDKVASFR